MTTDESKTSETILKTKLVQLERARDKADNALKAGKEHVIRRHIVTLKELLKEVNKYQSEVEAHKITSKEDPDEIDKWSDDVESHMEEADQKVGILEKWLSEAELEREDKQRKERMDFELQIEQAKMKLKSDFTKTEAPASEDPESVKAKLPKLTITKFNASYADWPRFWGQYSETIHKKSIPPVTKFSYLRSFAI